MPRRTDFHKISTFSYGLIVIGLLASSLLCRAMPAVEAECGSVAKIDFQNDIVDWGGGRLSFKEDLACTAEGLLPGQDLACDCELGKCDWKMKISEEKLLSPEPNTQLRLLIIEENHLTGSGAWGRVLLYECRSHRLKKVMDQRYLYGVQFTPIRTGFELESGHWLPTDAQCCPSKKQRELFRWDSTKHKYIRVRRVVL